MAVAGEALRDRLMGFLMWGTILSSGAYISFRIFRQILFFDYQYSYWSASLAALLFIAFLFSNLVFSSAIHAVSSCQPLPVATLSELTLGLLRFVFFASSSKESSSSQAFRSRFSVTALLFFFIVVASLSSMASIAAITTSASSMVLTRGLIAGVVYSIIYLYKRRWIMSFPVIQRPLFFSFKLGIYPAISNSFKLANTANFLSLLITLLQRESSGKSSPAAIFLDEAIQYLGTFIVFLCWEINHHLYQILHTKRMTFSTSKGLISEANPNEQLLTALEDTQPGSLEQCLAYLDLCMVCESNVYTSRRSAFFEETSETYKRVVSACLKPVEQFISNVKESLPEKGTHLSSQMLSPSDSFTFSNAHVFNNFQQCAWGARAAASLTAKSHSEDRFGVAQLSSSNALVISTLISALLAVEAVMGKKTTARLQNNMGFSLMKSNIGNAVQKPRSGVVLAKAYSMADMLRASIYCIVCSFYEEMVSGSKSGNLEKNWVVSVRVRFASNEVVLQKLRLFIDFREN